MKTILKFAVFQLLLIAPIILPQIALAETITLNVHVHAQDNTVRVEVENVGIDVARGLGVVLRFEGKTQARSLSKQLAPGEKGEVGFVVEEPPREGTYPLYVLVSYFANGRVLSIANACYFNYRRDSKLDADLKIADTVLRGNGTFDVRYDKRYQLTILAPKEVKIVGTEETTTGRRYYLSTPNTDLRVDYSIFAILLDYGFSGTVPTETDAVSTKIVRAKLSTRSVFKQHSVVPRKAFFFAAVAGFLLALLCYLRIGDSDPDSLNLGTIALIRWAFSVFLVSSCFLIFHNAAALADYAFTPLTKFAAVYWDTFAVSGEWGIGKLVYAVGGPLIQWAYFEGNQYDNFARYIADPLYLYIVFGNYFVLRYLIKPRPSSDKYWQLMVFIFSLVPFAPKHSCERRLAKIGILALAVKAFYLPIISSWLIQNTLFLHGRIHNFWIHPDPVSGILMDFVLMSGFFMGFFIFLDTAIFAFGYATELPQLKNQIRSVEPTLLGWIVCLVCYPPFNEFFFLPFDHPLYEGWSKSVGKVEILAMVAIALLWGIFVWASIALGWKASNLTNRGTVDRGPYKYVRHPAYTAKVLVWIISGVFLAEYNFFLVLAFAVIYALRAWTEERHLRQDPEYLEYCSRVKKVCFPLIGP